MSALRLPAFGLGLCLELFDGALGKNSDGSRQRKELHTARFEPRQVQEIVDHRLQPIAIFARGIQQLGLLIGERAGDLFGAQMHRHAQGRERRTKLVRNRRHHVVF